MCNENEEKRIVLPRKKVLRALKFLGLEYTEDARRENDKGVILRITTPGYRGIVITAYDNDTVQIQGGSSSKARARSEIKKLLLSYMPILARRKKNRD